MIRRKGKTALVLAGGGIMGAAYEIGVVAALDQLFPSRFSSNHFDIFVGISAGSVIASLVANQVPAAQLYQSILRDEQSVFNWRRSDIYRFETGTVLKSAWRVTNNLVRIYRNYRRSHTHMSLHDFIYILQEQFPAGLFSLRPMQDYLCRSFAEAGLKDHFHELRSQLFIPAYDLDTGERVVFGRNSHKDVHICQAITASCAIPYFFGPQKIGGRYYIDGNTGRTAHIDIAIEQGAKLIILVNPRVPMNNDPDRICLPSLSYGNCASIANLGISCAWEQSQRIENQEKLALAMENYKISHPDVDILVLEPGPEDSLLFFQSPMSQVSRNHIMRYGYQLSLGQINKGFNAFSKAFKRQGIKTSMDNLKDILSAGE